MTHNPTLTRPRKALAAARGAFGLLWPSAAQVEARERSKTVEYAVELGFPRDEAEQMASWYAQAAAGSLAASDWAGYRVMAATIANARGLTPATKETP